MASCLLIILGLLLFQSDMRQAERDRMVKEQIERRGVENRNVLRAMRAVPRHCLVPKDQRQFAYEDTPLPIGLGQTISQPYIVAFMTDLLKPKKGMKVLEIGTGSGYQAAVLAEIVDTVYTLEIIAELGQRAQKNLKTLGYENIQLRIADGYDGWEEYAPFDAIIVTAAAKEIPPALIHQLSDGGKMVIPVDKAGATDQLLLVEKSGGKITQKNVLPVRFVPFTRPKEDKDD